MNKPKALAANENVRPHEGVRRVPRHGLAQARYLRGQR